jgi:hypothetical protein
MPNGATGEIQNGATGDMQYGITASTTQEPQATDPATEIMLTLLTSVLSIF